MCVKDAVTLSRPCACAESLPGTNTESVSHPLTVTWGPACVIRTPVSKGAGGPSQAAGPDSTQNMRRRQEPRQVGVRNTTATVAKEKKGEGSGSCILPSQKPEAE